MIIGYATAKDVIDYYGEPQPFTLRAVIVKKDGAPVAIGGVMNHPQGAMAVMEAKDGAGRKSIIMATRLAMKTIFQRYQQVYAIRDAKKESSLNYLLHIGFRPIDDNNEVFLWTRDPLPPQ